MGGQCDYVKSIGKEPSVFFHITLLQSCTSWAVLKNDLCSHFRCNRLKNSNF